MMRLTYSAAAAIVAVLAVTGQAAAGTLFVDNRLGSDRNDGVTAEIIDVRTGPVRSISRALQLAKPSDMIVISNTGIPYYDQLSIAGSRLSGSSLGPLRIFGNGATLTGARPVPASAWQAVGEDLWKIVPHRKGYFQLILDGQAVPEMANGPGPETRTLPEIPVGEWCAFKGAIYYQAMRQSEPAEQKFAIAGLECGITVFSAHDIHIADLTVQHFRLDGINIHDLGRNIVLENVTCVENGRAGLALGGSSVVTAVGCASRGNRKHAVLLREVSGLDAENCTFDVAPAVLP